MTDKTLADWQAAAAKEVKGKDLTWQTPEGIAVKPLYTAEDVTTDPGLPGFVHGQRQLTVAHFVGHPGPAAQQRQRLKIWPEREHPQHLHPGPGQLAQVLLHHLSPPVAPHVRPRVRRPIIAAQGKTAWRGQKGGI